MSTATELETITIGPEQNGICLSPDEFDAISEYDDCFQYELIRGVLVVNPMPSPAERAANEELGCLFRKFRDLHPEGRFLNATLPGEYICLRGNRRRSARAVWVGLGRHPRPTVDLPSIVVDFVAQSRRHWRGEYAEKRDEFFDAGGSEYWLVDPFGRMMTVFHKAEAALEQHIVREGEIYRTPLLPGFELDLSKLLAVADRWRTQ